MLQAKFERDRKVTWNMSSLVLKSLIRRVYRRHVIFFSTSEAANKLSITDPLRKLIPEAAYT